MSKLFNLKEWVTLPEAAKHLSVVLGEEVTEADLLHFALDGRLTLSINLVNGAQARCGRIVGPECIEWFDIPHPDLTSDSDPATPAYFRLMSSLRLHGDREEYVNLSKGVVSIDGVWDLPLLGGDRLDIEHRLQMLIGGHPVTSINLEGSFLRRTDLVCQLQESMDENEYAAGSTAQLAKLEQYIHEEGLPAEEAEVLLTKHREKRKEVLADRKAHPSDGYYPAGGLPADCNLVVRTCNLTSFIQSISASPNEASSSLSNKERASLLRQIAGLALALAGKSNKYKQGDAPNANQIAETVIALVKGLDDANDTGLSSASIRKSIAAGIKLLQE